jgi:hypothetical protein
MMEGITRVAVLRELVTYDGVMVHAMSGGRWRHEDVVETLATFQEWKHGATVAPHLERYEWLSEPLSSEVCGDHWVVPEIYDRGEQLARALCLPYADEARVRCCPWRRSIGWLACLCCCLSPVSMPACCT